MSHEHDHENDRQLVVKYTYIMLLESTSNQRDLNIEKGRHLLLGDIYKLQP